MHIYMALVFSSPSLLHSKPSSSSSSLEDRVSLCSPSCPGAHSVDQGGFELKELFLSLPPES